jgi:deoxyribose-phosphate aldolase
MHNISRFIDHTLLRPDATEDNILSLCNEAREHGFFAVCVYPYHVAAAAKALFHTHVKVASVIGFPHGMTCPEVKIYEAIQAVLKGADELDIVMNIGLAKSGNWDAVKQEISNIIAATPEALHKIIIETSYLEEEEKKAASLAVMDAGAEFVKTSTGYGPSGAELDDIKIITSVTKGKVGIKAAGGIKTLTDARAFIEAGAARLGTSSGIAIMKEIQEQKDKS